MLTAHDKQFTGYITINAQTIIWFTAYDYDTLWTDTLLMDDLSKIWKDTGLASETFAKRSGYYTWKSWMGRSRKQIPENLYLIFRH